MHSLYWRIFLTFWLALALILVGTVTVAVNAAAQHRADSPWVQRGQLYAQAARAFESGGPKALRAWLEGLGPNEHFNRAFVVEPSGKDMLGRPLPPYLRGPGDGGGSNSIASGPIAPVGGALVLVGADGATYHVVVGPLRPSPRLFGELEQPGVPTATLLLALVVSAVVCFLLARYLVAPVDRLRHATRRMAGGDLNVRVSQSIRGRQDDLGLLASDLDTMAERLRNLLETKQQLLRDVSHELRSPLARLQLALSLARRQENNPAERHLARIACEADRLEQLIARTLKLARLERPTGSEEHARVDIGELLRTIADDVAIEADAQGCVVSVQADAALEVLGDVELLRSSFENIIRNAVRYSPPGTQVGVTARRIKSTTTRDESIEVIVYDQGPGVPEKDLALIFEPFYRVGTARDRAGGGEGLGLAIAARAVALHHGVIEARNLPTGGLVVSVTLPALAHDPTRDTKIEEEVEA
jgi:signal transduction histidine kinase